MGSGTRRKGCKHNIIDSDYVICPYCKKEFQMIHWQHIKVFHPTKTLEILLNEFPNYPTMTRKEADRRSTARIACSKKLNKTNMIKYGGTGFLSSILKNKTIVTMRNKYGVDNIAQTKEWIEFITTNNPMKNPEIAKKAANSMKGKPSKLKGKTYEEILGQERANSRREEQRYFGAIGQSLTPKISVPQLILYEIVKSIDSSAILEHPTFGYCLDIAIPNKKIALEYDCWYWHQDEERDKARDEILSKNGWKIFRFKDRIPTKKEIKKILK